MSYKSGVISGSETRTDPLIDTAVRALERGDALAALQVVALRQEPLALCLRGIALAQLGELPRARELLRAAARGFGKRDALRRARAVLAEAEVAFALRELDGSGRALELSARTLEQHGDRDNALHARLLWLRRLLLLGRLQEARTQLAALTLSRAKPVHVAVASALEAELELRALHVDQARSAFVRARRAARASGIPALQRELERAENILQLPAARVCRSGSAQDVTLEQLGKALAASAGTQLIVDACQRNVRLDKRVLTLHTRPILFVLLRALAERWPESVPRDELIEGVFGVTGATARMDKPSRRMRVNDSHRARLRVEITRLRKLLGSLARVEADASGFVLRTRRDCPCLLVLPLIDGEHAAILALLADGAPWSSSALALALGVSQRGAQRALTELHANGEVRAIGRARAQRWLGRPRVDFATTLLLPLPRQIG